MSQNGPNEPQPMLYPTLQHTVAYGTFNHPRDASSVSSSTPIDPSHSRETTNSSFAIKEYDETESLSSSPDSSMVSLLSSHSDDIDELEGQSCFVRPIAGCTSMVGSVNYPTTLLLQNKNSTARDNLSIERTFLAWLRISTIINLLGVLSLFRADIPGSPTNPQSTIISVVDDISKKSIGIGFICVGTFTLFWALSQYFRFQREYAGQVAHVENGKFNFFVAFIVGAFIFVSLVHNIAFEDSRTRKGLYGSAQTPQSLQDGVVLTYW